MKVKRKFPVIFTLCLLIALISPGVILFASEKGDLNNDQVVDQQDTAILERAIHSLTHVNDRPEMDFDDDGLVDFYDLFRLRRFLSQNNDHLDWDVRLPVREFDINFKGPVKPINFTDPTLPNKYEAELKEISTDKVWNVKYRRHGGGRIYACPMPPLNLDFQVEDLFPGFTTYDSAFPYPYNRNVLRTIGYEEIRLHPYCEVLQATHQEPQKINALLREYISQVIFRMLKVPTSETIAFAKFRNIRSTLNEVIPITSNNFMFLQRDNNAKDENPFFKQFHLDEDIAEASEIDRIKLNLSQVQWWGDRFSAVGYDYVDAQGTRHRRDIHLDLEHSIRHFILTDLADVHDRGDFEPIVKVFKNEDYAFDLFSRTWKTIAFDFDGSWADCIYVVVNPPTYIKEKIDNAVADLGQRRILYQAYNAVARDIFSNTDNLNDLLLAIDKFPFPVEKKWVKHTLKARFEMFALYYNSNQFSSALNLPQVPFDNEKDLLLDATRLKNAPTFSTVCESKMKPAFNTNLTLFTPSNSTVQMKSQSQSPQVASIGQNIQLRVDASGTPPFVFQWKKNGITLTESPSKFVGTDSPVLDILNTESADQGNYTCHASNNGGNVISQVITVQLTNEIPPTVDQQPQDLSINMRESASFSVGEKFSNLSYQWFHNNVSLIDNNFIHGAQEPQINISPIHPHDGGLYYCRIRNQAGQEITSHEARLEVKVYEPIILNMPVSPRVSIGQMASFEITTFDPWDQYQWIKDGVPLIESSHIEGTQTPQLKIKNITQSDQGIYACLVHNQVKSVLSWPLRIDINPPPQITGIETSKTLVEWEDYQDTFTIEDDRTPPENITFRFQITDPNDALDDETVEVYSTGTPGEYRLSYAATDHHGHARIDVMAQDSEGGESTYPVHVWMGVNRILSSVETLTTQEDHELRTELVIPPGIGNISPLSLTYTIDQTALVQLVKLEENVLIIKPATNQFGTTHLHLNLSGSNGFEDHQDVTLSITSVNDDPVLAAVPTITIFSNTAFDVPLPASDIETLRSQLRFEWSSSNENLLKAANISVQYLDEVWRLKGTPVFDQIGSASLTLTLKDTDGGQTHGNVLITVQAPPPVPVGLFEIRGLPSTLNMVVNRSQIIPFEIIGSCYTVAAITLSDPSFFSNSSDVFLSGGENPANTAYYLYINNPIKEGIFSVVVNAQNQVTREEKNATVQVIVNSEIRIRDLPDTLQINIGSAQGFPFTIDFSRPDDLDIRAELVNENVLRQIDLLVLRTGLGTYRLFITSTEIAGHTTITLRVRDRITGNEISKLISVDVGPASRPVVRGLPETIQIFTNFSQGFPFAIEFPRLEDLDVSAELINEDVLHQSALHLFPGFGNYYLQLATLDQAGHTTIRLRIRNRVESYEIVYLIPVDVVLQDPPIIHDLPETIQIDTNSSQMFPFTIDFSRPWDLDVTTELINEDILRQSDVHVFGFGTYRTLELFSVGKAGHTTIRLRVRDRLSGFEIIKLIPVDVALQDPPIIHDLPETIQINTNSSQIFPFTIDFSRPWDLDVTAEVINEDILRQSDVHVYGFGNHQTLELFSVGKTGHTTIRLRVRDRLSGFEIIKLIPVDVTLRFNGNFDNLQMSPGEFRTFIFEISFDRPNDLSVTLELVDEDVVTRNQIYSFWDPRIGTSALGITIDRPLKTGRINIRIKTRDTMTGIETIQMMSVDVTFQLAFVGTFDNLQAPAGEWRGFPFEIQFNRLDDLEVTAEPLNEDVVRRDQIFLNRTPNNSNFTVAINRPQKTGHVDIRIRARDRVSGIETIQMMSVDVTFQLAFVGTFDNLQAPAGEWRGFPFEIQFNRLDDLEVTAEPLNEDVVRRDQIFLNRTPNNSNFTVAINRPQKTGHVDIRIRARDRVSGIETIQMMSVDVTFQLAFVGTFDNLQAPVGVGSSFPFEIQFGRREDLIVTAVPMNEEVVTNSQINVTHNWESPLFTVNINNPNKTGRVDIRIKARDTLSGIETIQMMSVIVPVPNTSPTITGLPVDRTMDTLVKRELIIPFRVTDLEDTTILVTAAEASAGIFRPSDIFIQKHSLPNTYQLFVRNPTSTGETTILITADDHKQNGQATAQVKIAINPGHIFSEVIPDQNMNVNETLRMEIRLLGKHVEITAESSNPTLIDESGLRFLGRQTSRTLLVIPKPNVEGEAIISLRATYDGVEPPFSELLQFKLTVHPSEAAGMPAPMLAMDPPPTQQPVPEKTLKDEIPSPLTLTLTSMVNSVGKKSQVASFDLEVHEPGSLLVRVAPLTDGTNWTTIFEADVNKGPQHIEWDPNGSGAYIADIIFNGILFKRIPITVTK